MEHTMLRANLMEVRGAESEEAARKYAEQVSGRIVEQVLHVVLGIYSVLLR